MFETRTGARVYYNPKFTRDTFFTEDTSFCITNGDYLGMHAPDSILISAYFQVMPVTNVFLKGKGFSLYSLSRLTDSNLTSDVSDFCVVSQGNKYRMESLRDPVVSASGSIYYSTTSGDLMKNNGDFILSGDTVTGLNYHNHWTDGSLYFTSKQFNPTKTCAYDTNGQIVHAYDEKELLDFTNRYAWYNAKKGSNAGAILIERSTGQEVLGKKVASLKAYPIWDSITIVETKKNGVRLYNINRRQYFDNVAYNEIVPLNRTGQLFAVRTCSNRIGVVNNKGEVVLDTIYAAITRTVYDTSYYLSARFRSEYFSNFYRYAVFYNEDTCIMLDTRNGTLYNHEQSIEILWEATTQVVNSDSLEIYLNGSPYAIREMNQRFTLYLGQKDSSSLRSWHMRCLIDSIYLATHEEDSYFSFYNSSCEYCRKKNSLANYSDFTRHFAYRYNYMVSVQTDSMICFQKFAHDYIGFLVEKSVFSTVMLFPDGPRQITLDSLFDPRSDWRNFIINTVIDYVNNHQGIEGDCHNPAGLPLMLNQSFEITAEELLLYPADFTEHGSQLVLHIKWSDADPYLRKDIRSKIPVR